MVRKAGSPALLVEDQGDAGPEADAARLEARATPRREAPLTLTRTSRNRKEERWPLWDDRVEAETACLRARL